MDRLAKDHKIPVPVRNSPGRAIKLFWQFPFTCGLSMFALAFLAAILSFNLELVHVQFFVQAQDEITRIDDCLAVSMLIVIGFFIDRILAARKAAEIQIQAQRLRVLQATMRTVHDIVNNFLNNLQLIHLEAEDALPPAAVKLLDRLTQETAAKLKALGDLESVTEKQLSMGVGIDYGQGDGNTNQR